MSGCFYAGDAVDDSSVYHDDRDQGAFEIAISTILMPNTMMVLMTVPTKMIIMTCRVCVL